MLPSINTQDWAVLSNDWVLVGVGLDLNLAGLVALYQPGPSTALDTSQCSVELALELAEGAVGVLNRRLHKTTISIQHFEEDNCQIVYSTHLQSTRRLTTTTGALWGQVLPEKRVVNVAASVEVNYWLKSNLSSNVVLGLGSGNLLAGSVEAVHVCLVVVLVVQLHDLSGDSWLQSTEVI